MDNRSGALNTLEAAAFLTLSPRTLERYRVTGEGPRFLKLGRRVVYLRSDLLHWLEGCVRISTSDDGQASSHPGSSPRFKPLC